MRSKTSWAALAAVTLAAAPIASAQIDVGELPTLDGWAAAAVPRGERALPGSLWAATDASLLAALLEKTPQAYASPTAQSLAVRVLTSSGAAPAGVDGPRALRKRYEALGRLGQAAALDVMIVGPAAQDPATAQFAAQADLARGDFDAACRRARTSASAEPPPPFVVRLRAVCLTRSGDAAGGDLLLDVAGQEGAGDPWLRSVLPRLAGAAPPPPAPGTRAPPEPGARYDTSLNAAVSLSARLRAAPTALNGSSSFALMAVARDENAAGAMRYGASLLALRYGLIDREAALPGVRAGLVLPAPDPKSKAKPPTPPPLALTLQELDAAADEAGRAAVLTGALRRAETAGAFIAASRLLAGELQSLRPSAMTQIGAASFTRAALALNQPRLARTWRGYVLESDPAAAALDAALAALGEGDLSAALAARLANAGSNPGAAARDAQALAAIGALSPSTAAAAMAVPRAATAKIDPDALGLMNAASARGAIGETALAAALALADGAEKLSADQLVQVIRALKAVGLDREARAVAAEAIVGDIR